MSFEEILGNLVQEGVISVVWLVGDDNQIHYTYGEWAVDPTLAFHAWKNQSGSYELGGIKFTSIVMDSERLISTNIAGNGHVLVAKCPKWPGAVVTYSPPAVQKELAYASTARLASKIG